MLTSNKMTIKLAFITIFSLCCIAITGIAKAAPVFGADRNITENALIGQKTTLEITASLLNETLSTGDTLAVCIGTAINNCSFIDPSTPRRLGNKQLTDATETYNLANASTVEYTPSSTAAAGDTFHIQYQACVITDGCIDSSKFYTGYIVFTVTGSTPAKTAGDIFKDEVCPSTRESLEVGIGEIGIGEIVTDKIIGRAQKLTVQEQADLCTEYNNLTEQEKISVLDSINPEEVVAQFTVTKQLTTAQVGNIFSRISQLRSGNRGTSVAGLTYSFEGKQFSGQWLHAMADSIGGAAGADEAAPVSKWGFFINGSLTDGKRDSTDLERGYDNDANTVTLGADYRLTRNLIGGIAYGISQSSLDFDGNNDGMDNDMSNIMVYGTWYKDAFNIDVLVGQSTGEIETTRVISIVSSTAVGETDSQQTFFSIASGYNFNNGALSYGPYAHYDYVTGEIDSYVETNGGGLEVGFNDQDIDSQVFTMGGQVSYALSTDWGVIVPHARAEWKKEFDDSRDIISGQFVSTAGQETFSIEADDFDNSWFHAGIGVSATFRHGLSAYIDYDSIIGYDETELSTLSYGGRWEASF